MMNHHFASTQSSCTWSSPFAPWTACATFIPPSPSRVTRTAPCTSYPLPQVASTLIHLVHTLDHGYSPHHLTSPALNTKGWRIWSAVDSPHTINLTLVATTNHLGPYLIVTDKWAVRSAPILLLELLWSSISQSLGELML